MELQPPWSCSVVEVGVLWGAPVAVQASLAESVWAAAGRREEPSAHPPLSSEAGASIVVQPRQSRWHSVPAGTQAQLRELTTYKEMFLNCVVLRFQYVVIFPKKETFRTQMGKNNFILPTSTIIKRVISSQVLLMHSCKSFQEWASWQTQSELTHKFTLCDHSVKGD